MSKKFLFILVAIMISMSSFAQLRHTVDGITLGVTTKTQLLSKLRTQHKRYRMQGNNLVVVSSDNNFGGVLWFATFYRLHKGKVYKITYSKHANTSDTPMSLINSEYSNLQRSLNNKYRSFYTRDYNSMYGTFACFKDAKTRISVEKGYYEGTYMLSLIYVDIKEEKQSFIDENDEL